MELEKEFIEQHNLTEEQVSAITGKFSDVLANEKKTIEDTYSGKANENAEGILTGALKSIQSKYGFTYDRPQGEKIADSVNNALGMVFGNKQTELDKMKTDYEQKIKDAKGVDIKDIERKYEQEKDDLLKKYVDYDEIKEKAAKADEYGQQLSGLKLQVAYSSVKPNFPETVNPYEAKAKWDEFVKGVNEKYTIELDENNEAIAISKENKHKIVKLKELVDNDSTIKEITQGRQQQGLGGQSRKTEKIDGVPFDVPVNASTKDISQAIKDYLVKQNIGTMHKDWDTKFKELWSKIKQKTAA